MQKCTPMPLMYSIVFDFVKVFDFPWYGHFKENIKYWHEILILDLTLLFLKLFISLRTFKWTIFHCSTPILIFLYKRFGARTGKIFDRKGQKDPGLKKFWKKITRVLGSWVNSCWFSFDEIKKSVFFWDTLRLIMPLT